MSVSGRKPAHTSVSAGWVFVLFTFLLGGISGPVAAVTVSGLYSARVPVAGASPGQLAEGYSDGLSQVLVRVSGTRDVLSIEGVEALLSDAESLLLSYQVVRDDSGQSVLDMSFGAVGVNRALAAINAPVWGANRPLTLAWIAAEERGSRTLVTDDTRGAAMGAQETTGTWQAAFDAAARKRGLPVALPPASFTTDRELLSDIWGQFIGRVKAASGDLAHDVLALVRVSRVGDQWRAGWVFDGMSMNAGEESVTAPTRDAVAEAMINRWAELYASRYAVDAAEVGESPQVDIVVRGVNSLEDYARVNQVLGGLTPVVNVGAHRVRDDQLTLRVAFSGELDQLKEYIALDPRFVSLGTENPSVPAEVPSSSSEPSAAPETEATPESTGEQTAGAESQSSADDSDGPALFTYEPVPVDEEDARQAFESLYQVLYYRWQPQSVIGRDGGG